MTRINTSGFLLLCFLVLIICVFGSSCVQGLNHTENIDEIQELLNLMEDRIEKSLENKESEIATSKYNLEQEKQDRESQIQTLRENYIASKTKAKTEYEDAQEEAKKVFEQAKKDAENQYDEALSTIQEQEETINKTVDNLEAFENFMQNEKERLDSQWIQFQHNLEAEMELLSRIREMLNHIQSNKIKGVLEPCNERYACLDPFECIDNQCQQRLNGTCNDNEECASGVCFQGICRERFSILGSNESGLKLIDLLQSNDRYNLDIQQAQVCYRASRDGLNSNEFHNRCDGKSPTLTAFRTENGYEFGVFSRVDSGLTTGYYSDPDHFVFSLKSPRRVYPQLFPAVEQIDRITWVGSGYCNWHKSIGTQNDCDHIFLNNQDTVNLPSEEYLWGNNGEQTDLSEVEVYYW